MMKHDAAPVVWGVAAKQADGQLAVRAYRSRDAAAAAADQAPRVMITGPHPNTGEWMTVEGVWPLVYHHAEDGWTFAAIGWAVSAHHPGAELERQQ